MSNNSKKNTQPSETKKSNGPSVEKPEISNTDPKSDNITISVKKINIKQVKTKINSDKEGVDLPSNEEKETSSNNEFPSENVGISDNEINNFTDNVENKNKNRLKEIITILRKNKAIESMITSKHPERVRVAFEELGPSFVKMGQMLSTRTDLVPESFADEFKKLQDGVKSDDFPTVKAIIEKSFDTPLENIFNNFSETPLASASMAQVHLAELKDGTKVAVKVQHAGIKELMLNDVALFEKAIPFFKIAPASKIMDPADLVKELKSSCENELDLRIEGRNIHLFYKNNSQIDYMECLKAYPDYTKENILVMDYVIGVKVTDVDKLKAKNWDVKLIAQNLVNNYMKQAFEDGFFHADPHPGNIFIRDAKITFIDFGMMGVMSDTVLNKLNDVLYAIYIKDTGELSKAVLKLCIRKGKVDKDKLTEDIDEFYYQYVDNVSLKDMKFPIIIKNLTEVCLRNNLAIPEEVTMFVRGIINIVGVIEVLDSDLTIMSALEPYMQKYIANKFNLVSELKDYAKSVYDMGKIAPQIPIKLAKTLDKINDGDLRFQIQHNNLEKLFNQLDNMTNKIVIGMLLFALIVGSSILANSGNQFEGHNIMSTIGVIGYVVAAILTVVLIFSIMKNKNK